MTPRRIVSVLMPAIVVPIVAVAALSFFTPQPKPCFVAGTHAYRLADSGNAQVTVRVAKAAARPDLRLQLVNNPAVADFVLVDDGDKPAACHDAGPIKSIRLDNASANPDLTVALSQAPAPHKIYVRSAHYTAQDAAALFAVMRQDARRPRLAARE